ncbi:MAG TPA: hypothetical protein VGQ83_38475 [Polyangia bacterium]
MTAPLPPFDPLGLPAPGLLVLALAYLTLTLHLCAMGFTVGSGVLLLGALVRRRPADAGLARFLGGGLPLGFSYLVTFGVPPLLFLQVVYGQFFYSSSVLVGAFWIAVIPLLITGYGAAYLHKLTRERRPGPQRLVVGVVLACVLAIGFIYVNNLTLALTPERWLDAYRASPGGGALNLREPTVPWRYLLFLAPGLGVAGLALIMRGAVLGGWGRDEEGRASRAFGAKALGASAVLVAAGAAGVVATLPRSVGAILRAGGPATLLAAGAAALGALAVVLGWRARGATRLRVPVLASVSLFGAMACLVVVRDLVRMEYLRPHFDLGRVAVHAQWGMFAIFAVSLVAGLALLIGLAVKVVPRIAVARRAELEAAAPRG